MQFCIADERSCKGLDKVKCTVGNKTPENPLGEIWLRAMERGIPIEKAIAVVRDGVSWDESQWDARTLGFLLSDLIVKVPVYNCLTRAGLRTVGDLVRLDFEQILEIKYLGKVVISEVVSVLHSVGVEGSAWDYLV